MHSINPTSPAPASRLPGLLASVCVGFGLLKLLDGFLGSSTGGEKSALIWLFACLTLGVLVYVLGRALIQPQAGPTQSPATQPNSLQAMPTPRELSLGIHMEVVDTLALPPEHWTDAPSDAEAFPLSLLLALDHEGFKRLCHAYFREKGIRAEPTSEGPDSGFDIRIFQDTSTQPQVIVQCRAGKDGEVELSHIKGLHELMVREGIGKGFYLTRGSFSEQARSFAQTHQIFAIDGKLFVAMIDKLPESTRARLLALAKGE